MLDPLLLHFCDQYFQSLVVLGLDRGRHVPLKPGDTLLLVFQKRLEPQLIFGIGLPQFAEYGDPIRERGIGKIHSPPGIKQRL